MTSSAKASIIDGKIISAELRARVTTEVTRLKSEHGLTPGLAVVLVGNDPASEVYVRNKGLATKEAGMNSYEYRLPADTSEADLLAKVAELNADPDVHGFLVQMTACFPVRSPQAFFAMMRHPSGVAGTIAGNPLARRPALSG